MAGRYRAPSAVYVIMLAGLSLWLAGHRRAAFSQSLEGADCHLKQRCGHIDVTYPFKLQSEPNCPSFSPYFDLDCSGDGQLLVHNLTTNKANVSTMRVLQLFSDSVVLDVSSLLSEMTHLPNGTCNSTEISTGLLLPVFPGPFVIADDNLFGSFGCTVGVVITADALPNTTASNLPNSTNSTASAVFLNSTNSNPVLSNLELGGCSVLCPGSEKNPECGGRTCCVSNLPHGTTSTRLVSYYLTTSPFITNPDEFSSTPCKDNYAIPFHPGYTNILNRTYGLKLKWAVPFLNSTSFIMDIQKSSSFACSKYSNIITVQEVPGYRCSCRPGYRGDGYSLGSQCADINECVDPSLNNCILGKSTCHNDVEGSYRCRCNHNYHVGDGLRNGSGCKFSPALRNVIITIGAVVFVVLLIAGLVSFGMYWKRTIKKRYFRLNGGVQLHSIFRKAGGKQELKNRFFTAKELITATENYADHTKLGMGGFGTVFKGVLANGTLVAIKKANRSGQDEGGSDQFLNELQILIQINHRNIVRLLGCCMETAVPLLVYEFVAHGTVRENLDFANPVFMCWAQRLKVARQTAEALAYLHAAASPPILHRDVKSTNVLLDDNLDAKVADFGASRLVPDGVQHVSTAVQGTIGYLDPEYFQTLQLTDRSDVYSLGVMLVELITGLKPIDSRTREPRFANLALLFIHRMQEGRGAELFDHSCLQVSSMEKSGDPIVVHSSMMAVAELARQCLAMRGVDRPSMSLLADELRHLTRTLEDVGSEVDVDETSPLVPRKWRGPKQHHEAGAVVREDADFIVQSSSGSVFIPGLELPMPSLA